ncbi:NAD(P)/FAD-dependent oxidoreductase [Stenotrophomonas aracearum]|jgi:thioredoxin reductase|uniref:NAD(P)/FAD-dependent oxidoreductase n=1 Tax=Stenotrophomonas aracearum TaxID=3003272 RepID=A0ABY9YD54_9GAMM|nr:NAD(P)/FAD-dependent oxidoreductase [Stenotrophomonas sp. A5588]WNH48622.1 NAD(P)/FAD-dependent oxidoreductase [Stenotrophomonas sp. A5588]
MSFDAVIVGGSFAGLSAAMMLARARRSVLVVDSGLPRNRFSSHSHGVLGLDGIAGSDLLRQAKAQLLDYSTVRWATDTVIDAQPTVDGFAVTSASGETWAARKLLLATGITDVLPELPGLAERWGHSVLHCPYCHGYEIGGGEIGLLGGHALSSMMAGVLADWGQVTLFAHGMNLDEETLATLQRRGVRIETEQVVALEGEAPQLSAALLADGRRIDLRALFVSARQQMASPLVEQLGCELDESPVGVLIRVDAQKQTTVPGVYAAGDATVMGNITLASAEGVRAGVSLHHALIS